jgi:hypothetical protein
MIADGRTGSLFMLALAAAVCAAEMLVP